MRRTLIYTGIGLAFLTLVFSIGYGNGYKRGKERAGRDFTPSADTLTIRDTIYVHEPKETVVYMDKPVPYEVEVTLRDTIHDTVTVYLPHEVRVYEGEDYKAQVSGVFPKLDWVEVYPTTKVVHDVVREKMRPKWSVGISAGYGYSGAWNPYIGIGIQRNLFTW